MDPPPYSASLLCPQDPETSSIRSAAPSYVSAAPSYTTTRPSDISSTPQTTTLLRSATAPSLDAFRMSSWSRITPTNPTARCYHSVASRRASKLTLKEQAILLAAALSGEDAIAQIKKKMDDEERRRDMRTLEDPVLVGDVAAELNRRERLRREEGWDVLEREDKRWDWLLGMLLSLVCDDLRTGN